MNRASKERGETNPTMGVIRTTEWCIWRLLRLKWDEMGSGGIVKLPLSQPVDLRGVLSSRIYRLLPGTVS